MKQLLLLALMLSSLNVMAKCPIVADSQLNDEQLVVKKLLDSAYRYKNEGMSSKDLSAFTNQLKTNYTKAAEFLNEEEVSAFILEQDDSDNICQNQEFPPAEALNLLIADKIFDTYYGCGCEN